ncbi:ABC transporter ATP-binding protein [Arthrobacter sp. YJM1]|nr:ABC transporter ATP-binding protein [Arthrobacter sp. YJM1]MDP5226502.1 ABC transporter ATP-binding protein [Arthrobacter sp. YJM1]
MMYSQAAPGDDPLGIVAQGLSRRFGAVHAVQHIDFHAPPGKVTALIGPNGAGKTTLLLMLASLLRPDAGTILIDGRDPSRDPAAVRLRIGWMPDSLGVWGSLTAREILVQIARFYRMPEAGIRERAEELLHLVHLEALADQPARVLSRGQQQRLSLARALVHDPSVLLLDEPASGLDPASRVDLRNLLRSLAGAGKAVVVSSHVLSELDEIADGAAFVSAGRTVKQQSVLEAVQHGRRYSVSALDHAALVAALTGFGVEFRPEAGPRQTVSVFVTDDGAAAALLAGLVQAGVGVVSFAPAAGALEEAYMTMETERR